MSFTGCARLTIAVAVLLSAAACDPERIREGETADVAFSHELAKADYDPFGQEVYTENCVFCHGPEGRGDGSWGGGLDPHPADLTKPRPVAKRGTPGGRGAVIRNGSRGSAMPRFGEVLPPEELVAVTHYVHELRHGPGTAPQPCLNCDCPDQGPRPFRNLRRGLDDPCVTVE